MMIKITVSLYEISVIADRMLTFFMSLELQGIELWTDG